MSIKKAKNFIGEEFIYNSDYIIFFKFTYPFNSTDDTIYYIYSLLDFEDDGFSLEKIDKESYDKLKLETVDSITLSVADTMDMVSKIATVKAVANKNLRSLGEELGLSDIEIPTYLLKDDIDER